MYMYKIYLLQSPISELRPAPRVLRYKSCCQLAQTSSNCIQLASYTSIKPHTLNI